VPWKTGTTLTRVTRPPNAVRSSTVLAPIGPLFLGVIDECTYAEVG
jgi:hypothetical protein